MGFFFSSRRRHTIFDCDWSSDVCSSDLSSGFGHRGSRMTQRPAHSDPFFDKPYEASASVDASWDSQGAAAPKAGSGIKPKRKLAALFKAPVAPVAPVPPVAPDRKSVV